MKFALLSLLALATPGLFAQSFYVYGGRVAIGPRVASHRVRKADDLAYSHVRAVTPLANLALGRLKATTTYRCELRGRMRLVGLEPGTSAVRSEYRVSQVSRCHVARVRDMVAANRGNRP